MRSKYTIQYNGATEHGALTLLCTRAQANKAFLALAYAMAGSSWVDLELLWVTARSVTRVNRATFNGAIIESEGKSGQ